MLYNFMLLLMIGYTTAVFIEPTDKVAKLGDSVMFTCITPESGAIWIKDGKNLCATATDPNQICYSYYYSNVHHNVLMYSKISPQHYGKYHCVEETSEDNATCILTDRHVDYVCSKENLYDAFTLLKTTSLMNLALQLSVPVIFIMIIGCLKRV